jgi:ketosteroid isomerase-like protein
MTPEDFPRLFAAAFGARDSDFIAGFLAPDAQVVSLTGVVAEDQSGAKAAFATEFAGIFATARLVTGRHRLQMLGPGGAVLHQRFVVTGAQDAAGREMARFGAMLTAVLLARPQGWQAISLTFSALT